MDMAARRLDIDPVELRRRNLVREAEFPYKAASGIVWDRSGFVENLEAAWRAIDYPGLRRKQRALRQAGRWFGIGVASYAELTGIGSRISAAPGMPINTGTETATVRLDSTGTVTAAFGVASHGQGLETTLAQVVAEHLGVRVQDVRVLQGDSGVVAHSTGTYASRSAALAGGAGTLAARELRERVLRAASHLLEAAVEDLDAANGSVFVRGTDRSMTFRHLAKAVYSQMGRLPKDAREELEVTKVYDPYFGTATSATHIVALEIDRGTYEVTIERYFVCEDCGRVINLMIVKGQVCGAGARHRRCSVRGDRPRPGRPDPDCKPRRLRCPERARYPDRRGRASRAIRTAYGGRLPRHGRRRDDRCLSRRGQRRRGCFGSARNRDHGGAGQSGQTVPARPTSKAG